MIVFDNASVVVRDARGGWPNQLEVSVKDERERHRSTTTLDAEDIRLLHEQLSDWLERRGR